MIRLPRSRENQKSVSLTNDTYVRGVLFILGSLLLIQAFHKASHALLLLFTAFFLALALNAPVNWVSHILPGKRRGSRSLGTTLSFLIVIIIIGAFLAVALPPLIKQTESFINAVPHLIKELRSQNSEVGKLIRKYHLQNEINNLSGQLSSRLKNSGGTAVSTLTSVGSSIFSTLTILVLTFMMLVEGPRWLHFGRDIIPDKRQNLFDRMGNDMYRVLKGYVNGQVILALIASGFITPALFILHVSYPIALIFVIFICGLIPMVGHTIGAVIVTVVAVFHSSSSAIILFAYYLLYQQFENYIIQPRIQANSTNMSPLLVFSSVVIGLSFGGILGGLVAIPAAGCIRIVVLEYLRSRKIISDESMDDAAGKLATAKTK